MAFTQNWRNFRRMQDVTVAAACLIYAGAVLHAFRVLPGGAGLITQRTLIWPAAFLFLSVAVPLLAPWVRKRLAKYVWMSFVAGFGQTPISVLTGIGVLVGAAAFIYWQVAAVKTGGRYPAGVFSGYAAGIGILIAQAALVRRLERAPEIRAIIEDRDQA